MRLLALLSLTLLCGCFLFPDASDETPTPEAPPAEASTETPSPRYADPTVTAKGKADAMATAEAQAKATAEEMAKDAAQTKEATSSLLATQAAAKRLGATLKENLLGAMREQGPVGAAAFCSTDAAKLTSGVTKDTGVKVGRSSLRLRNPKNAGPDWVTAWLEEQGERPAKGVLDVNRIETLEDGSQVARVIRPLPVGGACLLCHGPDDTLAPELKELLATSYPDDAATGYAVGDLRGALWAESTVRPPTE